MSANAISAQGSVLEITNGNGTALAISAISQSFPARVTFTPAITAVDTGDQVTFASVGGMTQLNGLSAVAEYVDYTNRIITLANVDSRAFTAYTSGGTATPALYVPIKDMISFSGLDGMASELDVTDLDSTAKEFQLGLVDNGGFSFECNRVNTDAGQLALEARRIDRALVGFRLALPAGGGTATFNARVKKKDVRGGVDQVLRTSIEVRITGPVTWS